MPNREEISGYIGSRYGKLKIISDAGFVDGRRRVIVLCDCGKEKNIDFHSIKYGKTIACGCVNVSKKTKHGLSSHSLRRVWTAIKSRCYNINDKSYINYGGRGVVVCENWKLYFKLFHDWCLSNGWEKGMDVDKDIKSKGPGMIYSPEYCSIVKRKANLRDKRSSRVIFHNGESKCLSEWCEAINISRRTVEDRLKKGWSIDRALTPFKRNKND